MRPRTWEDELFGSLSARAKTVFFVAVFFTFAPIAILFDLGSRPRAAWFVTASWAVYSGLTAVGWALGFTLNRRLLALVVPLSALLPMLFGGEFWKLRSGSVAVIFEIAGCIALIAAGYVCFIHFIGNEGVTSLRLRTEMSLAKQIHADLVPPVALTTAHVHLFGASLPTTEVGGDLLDVVEVPGRTTIAVADVSGHGVAAGVLMAMIKSARRTRLLDDQPLAVQVSELNEMLVQVTRPTTFATFAAMRFDGADTVEIGLAGHLPIFHFDRAANRWNTLANEHPPLGIVPGHRFTARQVPVASGDLLVLYTDGLTEVFAADETEFGEDRLLAVLAAHSNDDVATIHAAAMDAVRAFGAQHDDQTLLVARVL